MKDIYNEIVNAFNALWRCRMRGNSLEIATPVPTSTNKYVTVFLTERDGRWIVSDGGMIIKGMYDCDIPFDNHTYANILSFFKEDYNIKETYNRKGETYYYKYTTSKELIPNIVFDLANFIALAINDALIEYNEKTERIRFTTTVKDFLSEKININKISFNTPINDNSPAKFGAIIEKKHGRCSLLNMATGSTDYYMKRSIAQSNLFYDMLHNTKASNLIDNKIVLVNDCASGYNKEKLAPYLALCQDKGQEPLLWTKDQKVLIDRLTA